MSVLLYTSFGDLVVDLVVQTTSRTASSAVSFFVSSMKLDALTDQRFVRLEKDFALVFPLREDAQLQSSLPEEVHPPRFEHFGTVGTDGRVLVITLRDRIESYDKKFRVIGRVVDGGEQVLRKLNSELVVDRQGQSLVQKLTPKIKAVFVLCDFHGIIGNIDAFNSRAVGDLVARHEQTETSGEEKLVLKRKREEERAKVLFICKLNPVTEETDLKIIFTRFGEVLHVRVVRDLDTKESMRYGFVEFRDNTACERAHRDMQNAEIDGKRVVVDFAQG